MNRWSRRELLGQLDAMMVNTCHYTFVKICAMNHARIDRNMKTMNIE